MHCTPQLYLYYTIIDWPTSLPEFLVSTVESPIKDTPNKGHNRKNLSIKDTL